MKKRRKNLTYPTTHVIGRSFKPSPIKSYTEGTNKQTQEHINKLMDIWTNRLYSQYDRSVEGHNNKDTAIIFFFLTQPDFSFCLLFVCATLLLILYKMSVSQLENPQFFFFFFQVMSLRNNPSTLKRFFVLSQSCFKAYFLEIY